MEMAVLVLIRPALRQLQQESLQRHRRQARRLQAHHQVEWQEHELLPFLRI